MTEAQSLPQAPITPHAVLNLDPAGLYDRDSLKRVASETTLIRWERKGKLKSIALGRKRFYLGSDLLTALQSTK